MSADMSDNLAMQRQVSELPNGLYLLRDLGDRFVILYPAEVVNAIGKAQEARLLAEKSKHVAALDEINRLKGSNEARDNDLKWLRDELAAYARQQSALLARKRSRKRTRRRS